MNEKVYVHNSPLYLQIANLIRDKIYAREWRTSQKIPSEHRLCEIFDVSRGTVRKALTQLVEEGLLVQRHGQGTFVSDRGITHPAGVRPLSFAESLRRQGKDFECKVITKEVIPASQEVADILKIHEGDLTLHLVRVKCVNGEPLIVQDSFENLNECPGLDDVDFSQVSAFDAVQNTAKRTIQQAKIRYSARYAGDIYADLLQVDRMSPVLVLEQEISLIDGSVIEWSFTWLKADQEVVGMAVQTTQREYSLRNFIHM